VPFRTHEFGLDADQHNSVKLSVVASSPLGSNVTHPLKLLEDRVESYILDQLEEKFLLYPE
jgi:hypothetical protein